MSKMHTITLFDNDPALPIDLLVVVERVVAVEAVFERDRAGKVVTYGEKPKVKGSRIHMDVPGLVLEVPGVEPDDVYALMADALAQDLL